MLDKEKNSLDRYLKDIEGETLLTQNEEQSLAERIRRGDREAVERLITANLRVVIATAHHYQNKGMDVQDLVSEGNIGLIRAAEKFDAGRGTRFVSYAVPFIRKCMEKAIEEQSGLYRIPKGETTKDGIRKSKGISADAPLGGRDNVNLLSLIENPDAPKADVLVDESVVREELACMLEILDEREREVLVLFFGMNGSKLTFAEIGEKMGLKRERVRQVRDKAIRKILRHTGNAAIKAYFEH